MFIAKNGDLIVLARETEEELLQGLKLMNYDVIEETSENYVLHDGQYLTEDEVLQRKQEYIAMLSLTAADVERGIYKAKGLDFDDILAIVEAQPVTEGEVPTIDIKALRIELKANNFYRGNPYVELVGSLLGFTTEQLDKFFKTNDYTVLLPTEDEK